MTAGAPREPPVAAEADFERQRDQAVGVQLVLRPPEGLPQQLLLPPPLAAACGNQAGGLQSPRRPGLTLTFWARRGLTWQGRGAGELAGQLELGGVPLHGGCDQQLEGSLE